MPRYRTPAPRSGSLGVRVLVVFLLLALVIGAAWGIHLYLQQPTQDPAAASSQSPDLITDDRIIFGGLPRAKNPALTFTILKNDAYIVGYSESRKDPLWSAYRVKKMEHPFILDRPKGNFLTDTRTQAQVKHHDFTGYDWDRGHMTPNAAIARCYGAEAQRQTFLLSNICPQSQNLNRLVWEHLEKEEFTYADHAGEVWIIDGPIFGDMIGGQTTTLKAGIAIPESFYKILIEDHTPGGGNSVRAFAVIIPQSVKGTERPSQFTTTIKQIEDSTGLEFLWKLDPKLREQLESAKSPMWDE